MSARTRVCLVFALGYFMSYVYRGVNLVLAPLLMHDVGLDAASLGMLTSTYLLAFACMQLPVGVLLDRYGPRKVVAVLMTVAAAGAVIFASGHSLLTLMIGRALIGAGVACCLNGAIKAIALWFPPDRLSLMNGLVFGLGGLGGAATGTPLEWSLGFIGWRTLFLLLAACTFAVALLQIFVVPEHPQKQENTTLGAQIRGLVDVLRSRLFWSVTLFIGVINGLFLAVQGLWAGPFMREFQGLDSTTAANLVVVIAVTMVAGGLLQGWVVREIEQRGISAAVTAGVLMVAYMLLQIVMLLRPPVPPSILWGLYGFLGSAGILGYVVMARIFPPELLGRVATASTLAIFVFAFLFQIGFGAILDRFADGGPAGLARGHAWTWIVGLVAELIVLAPYVVVCLRPAAGAAAPQQAAAADPPPSR